MNCKNVSTKGLVWQKNFFVVVESLSINYLHAKWNLCFPSMRIQLSQCGVKETIFQWYWWVIDLFSEKKKMQRNLGEKMSYIDAKTDW